MHPGDDEPAYWLLHATGEQRFPFRLSIVQLGRPLLALRVRERWPGPGMQIFCMRDAAPVPEGEALERVPVLSLRRLGRKLGVVLDRPTRRRCDFLFLTRAYKERDGEYEQIFWRTEQAVRAHRSRSRAQLRPGGTTLDVAIDVAERYPWTFPASRVERRKLAGGDYALLVADRPVAVVERKSFPNLLAEIATLQAFHQKLTDLEGFPHAALVVEAQYGDFLDPSRIGRWTPRHLSRVLAELAAMHPRLPIVYAGNRKLANEWTVSFFAAVAARLADQAPLALAEATAGYRPSPGNPGLDETVRAVVLRELPPRFSFDQLRGQVREADAARLRRVLAALRAEGRLVCEGRGRGARWSRVERATSEP